MPLMNETLRLRDVDPAFLSRYDLAGPRYTSYPTAPEWSAAVDGAAVANHLKAARVSGGAHPLSLYVHIPFCIERCAFCACNVIASTKMEKVSDPYLDLIERELDLWAGAVDPARPVVQMHWGGGTPTYLNTGQLRRLHAMIARRFKLASDAEKSTEIHVTWTSDEQILELAEMGFNRLSLGVQDFTEDIQVAIGRRQTFERTREIFDLARRAGFKGINVDIIYGLPGQTARSFGETIDRLTELAPDRLAVYNFAYLPARLANQRAIDPASLPKAEEKIRIFLEAHDRLVTSGYRYIGMDHFALPGDELARAFDEGTMQRNFMGFTTRAGADLLAAGLSAISWVEGLYAQNVKKLSTYRAALAAGRFPTERGMLLSHDDLIRRDLIQSLMCRDRIDKRDLERRCGIAFDEYFARELERLEPLAKDGLLTNGADSLELTFLGRVFVRNIAMAFDTYLQRAHSGRAPQFSRTV